MNLPENARDPNVPFANRFRGFLPVVIDVETGGFNARSDALLEIAAVTLRMDEDGNLDYVPEEEYTEELWNEQKKSGERNRAAALHK